MTFGTVPSGGGIPLSSVYIPGTASSNLTALGGNFATTDAAGNTSAAASVYLAGVGLSAILQKANGVTGGAAKTLAIAFGSNTTKGSGIIVSLGMGEVQSGATITLAVTDSQGNTFTQAAFASQSTTQEASIFYATNTAGGADTVTITIAGASSTTTAIAAEIYEVTGLAYLSSVVLDQTNTGSNSSSTAVATGIVTPRTPNELVFTAIAAAGGTITAGSGWTLDSGTLTPTGGNLVSFGSQSLTATSQALLQPNATLSAANAWAAVSASFRVISQPVSGTVTIGSTYNATVFAPGQLRVILEASQLFMDSFDSGTLDITNRWKSPTAAGGAVAASNTVGATILGTGTTANGYSYLESQTTFPVVNPGWLQITMGNNIPAPYVANTYFFWGTGTSPATPTAALPLTDAAGFEIAVGGKMYAVMYQGGTRNQIADLSAATGNNTQPSDSSVHYYTMFYRGDRTYWAIDSTDNIVASTSTGVPGPNVNTLPLKLSAIAGTSSPGSNGQLTCNTVLVGDTARNAQQLSDGVYPWRKATVKPTAQVTTYNDLPLVTALSPINTGLPVTAPTIVQKTSNTSTGSVASLAKAFVSNPCVNNSLIVSCAVGNGTAPTVTDTLGNTYTRVAQVANGSAFNTAIFYAVNVSSGANTVTVNNGGTTASIAMEIYEVVGLLAIAAAQPDITATNTGTSTTAATSAISAGSANEFAIAAVGIGTGAQTITVGSGWTNDSGQLNPTTPAGLFSFVSMSQYLEDTGAVTPQATFTSEPWAISVATFVPVLLGVNGSVKITDGTTTMAFGQGTMAASMPVVIASNQSSVAVTDNLTQIGGTNIVTGGVAGLIAIGGPVASGGSNADNPVKIGNVFNTTQPTVTNGQIVDVQATARGAMIVSTGVDTFNVTVNAAIAAGTNTIGGVTPKAVTTGGSTPSHTMSAASTNATSLKASAGQVYGLSITNSVASARYFKLYNKASAPTVGTDTPVLTLGVPANGTVIRVYPVGLALGTGIAWAATGAITNADTTAIGANDLSIDIDYL